MNRNACNCMNTSLGNVWNDCYIKQEKENQLGCTYKDKFMFFKESVVNKCKEYCPLECETISYSVNFNILSDFTTFNETTLVVYFESLKYTSISQLPKAKELDLISSIGGIFGLFIGVSFVTLFEIAELFIEFLFIFFERKNNKQLPKVDSTQKNSQEK